MDKIAIVILNYEAYEETFKCVDSILDREMQVEGIVIVDNASKNDSYARLREKYRNVAAVRVVRCKSNLGFARGNNIGIKVARNSWDVDGVLLLNSDTVMLEDDYLEKIMAAYEPGIGVMQTSALRLNGRYTQRNGGTYSIVTLLQDVAKEVCAYYNLYFPINIKRNPADELDKWVSGCDILLTADYFKYFNGLYPLTFLYGEEYILSTMLRKVGLRWKVVEDAHILHAESRSTPADFMGGRRKKQKLMLIAGCHKIIARVLPVCILQRIVNQKEWDS